MLSKTTPKINWVRKIKRNSMDLDKFQNFISNLNFISSTLNGHGIRRHLSVAWDWRGIIGLLGMRTRLNGLLRVVVVWSTRRR